MSNQIFKRPHRLAIALNYPHNCFNSTRSQNWSSHMPSSRFIAPSDAVKNLVFVRFQIDSCQLDRSCLSCCFEAFVNWNFVSRRCRENVSIFEKVIEGDGEDLNCWLFSEKSCEFVRRRCDREFSVLFHFTRSTSLRWILVLGFGKCKLNFNLQKRKKKIFFPPPGRFFVSLRISKPKFIEASSIA